MARFVRTRQRLVSTLLATSYTDADQQFECSGETLPTRQNWRGIDCDAQSARDMRVPRPTGSSQSRRSRQATTDR